MAETVRFADDVATPHGYATQLIRGIRGASLTLLLPEIVRGFVCAIAVRHRVGNAGA